MHADNENALKESNRCVCLLTRAVCLLTRTLVKLEAIQLSHFEKLFKIVIAYN